MNLPQTFKDWLTQFNSQNKLQEGAVRGPLVVSTGTTGATAASRYVGATASGSPTTGYHRVGDFVIAQNGHLHICTAAGSPGTWVDVGPSGGSGTGTNDDTVYVAAPTGVAATDNAAIAAAISVCPVGGVVQLQHGTYALIDAGTTTSIAISKALTLRGRGGADALWANWGTRLTVDHATAVGINITAHKVNLENFCIQNIHSTAPTAGAGIQTVSGGGNSNHYGPNLSVRGFYYNVDHQAGAEWFMDPSFFSYDFVYAGLRIQNVDSVDGGDMSVSGQFIAGPTHNATAGIQWLTGGGFKGYSIKVNTRGSATLLAGIDLELQDGVTTTDFILCASSIENATYGFLLEHGGTVHNGVFGNVVIAGNEFATPNATNCYCVAIGGSSTGKVSAVYVGGNVLKGSGAANQYGIQFTNIDDATHGPNVFPLLTGTGSLTYKDNGGNTNIQNLETSVSSPLTTKGDIWGYGSSNSRIAVGADGRILAADSAQALGVGYSTRDLDANTHKIINVTDPVSAQDAATKNYVDTHGSGGGAGGILTASQYAPVSLTTYNVTNTTGLTALDTTNLTVSFTVPASGRVIVRFSASVKASSLDLGFGLLNHSGGAQIGNTLSNVWAPGAASSAVIRLTCEWLLTGLSAGTLGLDIAAGISSAGTANVYAMGATGAVNDAKVGPAVIVVESA